MRKVRLTHPATGALTMLVFDMAKLGKEVSLLTQGLFPAGRYSLAVAERGIARATDQDWQVEEEGVGVEEGGEQWDSKKRAWVSLSTGQ